MASPLNKWSIYDCFYVRIELNDIVKERASLLGIKLSEEKIDEIANTCRTQLNFDSIKNQADDVLNQKESA
jgi:hypothetical protein|tara:strand:+ start:176 stop:388 length:213 start_codon:yes stop_codon:yes gene_type:complete